MKLPNGVISALWRAASRIGTSGRRGLVALWSQTAGRLPLRGQLNWARNIELATGMPPTNPHIRQAAGWWLRNLLESITLERWDVSEIDRSVLIDDADLARLRASFDGPGAVLALGHLGSWDLCGAWACRHGMPVTSVAEHLRDVRFERFLEARQALGMRIHPLSTTDVFAKLEADLAERRLICLLADRDLSGKGVRVVWPGTPHAVRVPVGPALLARRSGADLLVVLSQYEGQRMRIRIGHPIEHRDGESGLTEMMQAVLNELAAGVRAQPTNWHMYARYFRDTL